jgi:hypothetical protein
MAWCVGRSDFAGEKEVHDKEEAAQRALAQRSALHGSETLRLDVWQSQSQYIIGNGELRRKGCLKRKGLRTEQVGA